MASSNPNETSYNQAQLLRGLGQRAPGGHWSNSSWGDVLATTHLLM